MVGATVWPGSRGLGTSPTHPARRRGPPSEFRSVGKVAVPTEAKSERHRQRQGRPRTRTGIGQPLAQGVGVCGVELADGQAGGHDAILNKTPITPIVVKLASAPNVAAGGGGSGVCRCVCGAQSPGPVRNRGALAVNGGGRGGARPASHANQHILGHSTRQAPQRANRRRERPLFGGRPPGEPGRAISAHFTLVTPRPLSTIASPWYLTRVPRSEEMPLQRTSIGRRCMSCARHTAGARVAYVEPSCPAGCPRAA